MESLKELYKVGPGPSSSHTLAPYRACKLFIENNPDCFRVEVELYGSLSLTGKGHFTDLIITECFGKIACDVIFKNGWNEDFPNGFYIYGYDINNTRIQKWTVLSVGGGSIKILEYPTLVEIDEPYKEINMCEIIDYCKINNCSFVDYVDHNEPDIDKYLNYILDAMLSSVKRGLVATGYLAGNLRVERSAKSMHLKAQNVQLPSEKEKLLLMSYAYACSEENASLGQVVTSPTLGSCGVLAATMYYYYNDLEFSKSKLINALKVAGIFGNIVKRNATISGAVGGCQAEIGVACCMSAAACAYLSDMNSKEIEYAAEIAMEHHLGLTCDPVGGYVIIPCIERNAVAVLRAFDAMILSKHMSDIKANRVNFDMIVRTMNYTGSKLAIELKETSLGGLAKEVIVISENNNSGDI